MGGLGNVGKQITSVIEKVDPITKARNKVFDKIGLPTEKNLFETPEVEVEAPTVIPTEDSAAIAAARRRKTAEQMSRSGRQSTILSDRLGG